MLLSTDQLKHLLAKSARVSVDEASSFVDALILTVREHVLRNEEVTLQGLGTFRIIEAQSGQIRRLAFQPADSLKEAVNAPFSFFDPFVITPRTDPATSSSQSSTPTIQPKNQTL